jgi:dTDP-4-amino-4,6-dideoxygalactose transaminase
MSKNASIESEKVLNSGFIGQGDVVDKFENNLRNYFNLNYSTKSNLITLNSGTSALHLALHLLKKPQYNQDIYDGCAYTSSFWAGLQQGDEILSSPLTCTATNFPILANGLDIKWVDIDPKTLNMNLDDLEKKLTSKTKAIIVVHWGGYPNDLDRLKDIQNRFRLKYGFSPAIIEDCAHSFGSKYKGKLIGTHGNISAFSFQAIKHLTSVDGGMLILPHTDLYKRSKLMRWYGIDRDDKERKDFRCENDIQEWGFKFHMNDVNASIGNENLKEVDYVINRHIENGKFYDSELKNTNGLTLLERQTGFDSSYWIYSILVERRDDFHRYMKENGVACSQVHERNDKHSTLEKYKRTDLNNLDNTIHKITNIPVGWWVTDEDRQYIVDLIKKGW